MPTYNNEIRIVNELETYFKSLGLKTAKNVHNNYSDMGFFPERYYYVEIDLVIHKDDIEIPIEVKSRWNTDSIHKGIGQALSYLIFYDESWLAVPQVAIKLLTRILKTIKLQNLKIFDWQNKVLYEYNNGEVIGNDL